MLTQECLERDEGDPYFAAQVQNGPRDLDIRRLQFGLRQPFAQWDQDDLDEVLYDGRRRIRRAPPSAAASRKEALWKVYSSSGAPFSTSGIPHLGHLPGLSDSSGKRAVAQFAIDYTFWLNLLFVAIAAGLVTVAVRYRRNTQDQQGGGKIKPRSWVAIGFALIVLLGLLVFAFAGTR